MDNVTRDKFIATYDGPDEGPCITCEAEWVEVPDQFGFHLERNHVEGCEFLAWEYEEERQVDNFRQWCRECEAYVDESEVVTTSGFTGAPIHWITLVCGHQEVDASADNLDAVR